MKILFDARMSENSGIGTYIRNLLAEMLALPGFEFVVIAKKKNSLQLPPSQRVIFAESEIYTVQEQVELSKIANQFKGFVFWSPHFNIPLFSRLPLVVTIHDLVHFERKYYDGSRLKDLYLKLFFRKIQSKASLIFTPSQFTKTELTKRYPKCEKKTFVTHLGVDPAWHHFPTSINKKKQIVFVGNLKKNKGIQLLLQAFHQAKTWMHDDLLVIGAGSGFHTSEDLSHCPIDPKRVRFAGRLETKAMIEQVAQSKFIVCPSLYEGFGLPPIEALSVGTPVLCSDIPVFKEILEDQATYFKSEDVNDLAEKIVLMANSPKPSVRSDIALKYDWKKTADETAKLLVQTLDRLV